MPTKPTVKETIEAKLTETLRPIHLDVINESHQHNVPRDSETHFKVVIASAVFDGKNPVARHREVYRILDAELKGGVHALSVQAFSPSEWERNSAAHPSPPCLGGSKNES